jgi:hypothetical protein
MRRNYRNLCNEGRLMANCIPKVGLNQQKGCSFWLKIKQKNRVAAAHKVEAGKNTESQPQESM